MSVVLTVGTFDILNIGHINLFAACRKIAGPANDNNIVIASVNRDIFIETFKGKPPILSYSERAGMLLGLKNVDWVVENTWDEDLKPLITNWKPDFLVVGSDWAKKDYYAQIQASPEWLAQQKVTLLYVPYTENTSSTIIKDRVRES